MADIKQINTRIPLDLYIKVKIKAARTGKTVTEFIRESLQNWVKEEGDERQNSNDRL